MGGFSRTSDDRHAGSQELYHRIRAEDYPSMEELKAHPVVHQLDALSDYYSSLYGKTSEIETEERSELRKQIMCTV